MFKVTEADQQKQEEPENSKLVGLISYFGNCRPRFMQIVSPMLWQKEKEWQTPQLLKPLYILFLTPTTHSPLVWRPFFFTVEKNQESQKYSCNIVTQSKEIKGLENPLY